jgi:hypothetical protein
MWLVLLESAKNRFLGVDTPEQSMSSCVRYGTTCLLIRGVVGSVSSSIVRERYRDYLRAVKCKRGHGTTYYTENLMIARVP